MHFKEISQGYSLEVKDLRDKMLSRPLPLQEFVPRDLAFCSSERRQKFSLKAYPDISISGLNCFSYNNKAQVELITEKNQVNITLAQPLTRIGRHRIACTKSDGQGRFFWLGKEFSVLDCKK